MKILVLGGHGFIGHHLVKQLMDEGHYVVVVDAHTRYGAYEAWEYSPVLKQRLAYLDKHTTFVLNTINTIGLELAFSFSPEIVIHLAMCPNAKLINQDVKLAAESVIGSTGAILDLCVKYKVKRFVFASSSMVYGDFLAGVKEEAVPNPLTIYGSFKLQCERMCEIWRRTHGLEYTILRPSAVYGTRDLVVRIISKMTLDALKKQMVTIDGLEQLDFTYVTDVASAFKYAALTPECKNQIYNCTRGNARYLLEAAKVVMQRIPSDFDLRERDRFYPIRGALDSSKLMIHTDWRPKVDIEEGINLYLDWFLAQEYLTRF